MEKQYYRRNKNKSPSNVNMGYMPPQAIDMEEVLLGTIISFPEILNNVIKILSTKCFYKNEHNIIYQAILDLYNDDKPIDMITVNMQVSKNGFSEEVGGAYYITSIAIKSSTTIDPEYYANVIFNTYIQRELIVLFEENLKELFKSDADIISITNCVMDRIEELTESLTAQQVSIISKAVDNAISELKIVKEDESGFYIKTGLKLIDDFVWLCSGMILGIASARSAGKTSFLIKLMKGIFTLNKDVAALWFTMEDPDVKILRSFACMDTGISVKKMMGKGDKLSDAEMEKIVDCMNKYSAYDIQFVNESESITNIKSMSSNFIKRRKGKTCFIVIDNVMLIKDIVDAPFNAITQTEDKIAASFRNIINKAKKHGGEVVLIFLHHMTKEMENKANIEEGYRPKLSYMKGSTRYADVGNAIILLNKPSMAKDLIKRHLQLPHIKCLNSDGSSHAVSRKKLLENMLIAEIAKNRDGESNDDNHAIERYIVDFNKMSYEPLKCIR